MNDELKRRAFLASMIGILLGAPVTFHLLGRRKTQKTHPFSRDLKRLQALTQVSIQPMSPPPSPTLTLAPQAGVVWDYVLYAPAFLPKEFSHALGDEPDMFLAREGQYLVHRTNRNQTVLCGRDTNFVVCSPILTEERPKTEITLLLEKQQLHPAQAKDQPLIEPDRQFVHLLSLPGVPGTLPIGKKWKSGAGRVKPFTGYSTEYEIAGFAEVANHKTVQVRFSANIPNVVQKVGGKPDRDASMTNSHKGNAWFDLTTGFLVRQEVEMTTVLRSKEIVMKDKSNTLTVKADSILQLTTA